MTAVGAIAGLIPISQSLAIVGHNVGVAKKKKISTKDILSLGVTNVVGTSFIPITAGFTAGL